MAKVALILSGCGYLDGAEIHESVLCMMHLASHHHAYHCFAPNKEQKKVVNHLNGQTVTATRNILEESARIARGKISPIQELNIQEYDALLMPGGFGVALNFSDFATKGEQCSVDPKFKEIILEFYKAKKKIGATCISPVILAKAFEGVASVTMTLGMDPKYEKMLVKWGMIGKLAKVHECVADTKHLVYTTPCYMEPADLAGLSQGIEALVQHF